MESVVEQTFGEVHGGHAELLGLALEGHDELVAGATLWVGGLEALGLEPSHQIVGVQGGELGDPLHPLAAEQPGVDIGAQQDAHVAAEGRESADGLGTVALAEPAVFVPVASHQRHGQERLQARRNPHRTRPRTAAPMGRGEGLVQVHVDDVEAHVARAHLAEDGVEVGAVVIEQAPGLVHRGGDRLDVAVEDAHGARVGEHDAGGLGTDRVTQGRDVHVAVAAGGDLAHPVAAHDGRGGIGAVGSIGHQDLGPGSVAAGHVIGPDHGHPRELTLGTGGRRQGDRVHPRDLFQHLLQLEQTGEDPLSVGLRRRRVAREEPGQHGEAVTGPRVVLHGAGAQGIEVGVYREVLLGQPSVVAHRLELRDLGQRGPPGAPQVLGDAGGIRHA